MDQTATELEHVMALNLSTIDKVRLVERIMSSLREDIAQLEQKPKRSLLGIWADMGPAPSAEDIDEARREMWGNFPREDIL